MKVGFDAAPVFSAYGGIGQYVRSLFPIMVHLAPEIEWVGFVPDHQGKYPPWGKSLAISYCPASSWSSWRWRAGAEKTMDIFHGTNFKARDYGQRSTVLTIHDLWLTRNPHYSKKFFGQALSSWKLGRQAKRAAKVVAVSRFSAREIHEVFGVPLEKIAVIYHGCSSEMYMDRDQSRFREMCHRLDLSERPYIFFVGGAEPRKNHRLLFHAYSQSSRLRQSFQLVAVGNVESRGNNLIRTAGEYGIADLVCCPGFVTPTDLRILYSFATAFVFPSLYEGFGIPVVEAMACGTPMILAEGTALPEIGGDAAWYVNPNNPEQLRDCLERLLFDEAQQQHMTETGMKRAGQFTWEKAAQDTLNVYREVMA